MQFKLLQAGYKKNQAFYEAFVADQLANNETFFTDESCTFPSKNPFPIYLGAKYKGDKREAFLNAVHVLARDYIGTSRELYLEETVWHSYLVSCQRDYLIATYPVILESQRDFENIVTKNFDWENYIYKCVLVAEYVHDYTSDDTQKQALYELVYENLDLFNYMIKYPLFRNGDFICTFLEVVAELDLSARLKAKIKHREDLGDDERYGRRVLYELNQSYPVILVPLLDKAELKQHIVQALEYYEM